MQKVAIYARVSTNDKGQDIGLQLKDLRAYAMAREWNIFDEYADIGESGAKDKRPELNRLIDDAKKRKIDGILVWRLDRFGRSLKHLILTLEELNTLGIAFVSYKENLDFSSATGKLMFHLLGAFAEFERELTRERVKAGLKNAKDNGKALGRPPVRIDLEAVKVMRANNVSLNKIAEELNISKSTLCLYLRR